MNPLFTQPSAHGERVEPRLLDALAEGRVASIHVPAVMYRGKAQGSYSDELAPAPDGVLWLAFDAPIAKLYATPHYAKGGGVMWTVHLKPNAKILDLRDLSEPIIRELKEKVSMIRAFTWGTISDEDWPSFADFGIVEGYQWVRRWLRQKRVDGLLVTDTHDPTNTKHLSIALFNMHAVASSERIAFDKPRADLTVDQHVEWSKTAAGRVAARYKSKKEVPKADGKGTTTVYEYSERQVQHRNREKAKRVEGLGESISDLRKQVQKDLKSDEPKTHLTALAIGLMDATFERVGNDESADDGHFGVTGWLKKHVKFSKGRATIKYVGKSGVDHEKVVDDKSLVSALRSCCEDKGPNDSILSVGSGDDAVRVTAKEVNEYLKPFDISAKDVRGYHANNLMIEHLTAVRRAGKPLPKAKAERLKVLKSEFKEALTSAAEQVGHEPATLRTQYLVPGLEDEYVGHGRILDSFVKKTASAVRVAQAYLAGS